VLVVAQCDSDALLEHGFTEAAAMVEADIEAQALADEAEEKADVIDLTTARNRQSPDWDDAA